MDHVIIVNGEGKRKEIKVGILNNSTMVAVEESPDTYCLACGTQPINPEELEVCLIQAEKPTITLNHILLCKECSNKVKKHYPHKLLNQC